MSNSRRDFLRLSAGAAALAAVPGVSACGIPSGAISCANFFGATEYVSSCFQFGRWVYKFKRPGQEGVISVSRIDDLLCWGASLDTPSDTH